MDTERANLVFPLPLVPVEHWFMGQDLPENPMNFWVSLDFSGTFDQAALRKALANTLKKHPLFSALYQGDIKDKTSKNFWIDGQGISPFIDWDQWDAPLKFPHGMGIDLRGEPGIRFFIRESSEKSKILIQTHHACVDGITIIYFLKDVLQAYVSIVLNTFHEIQPPSNQQRELLLKRDHFSIKNRRRKLRDIFEKSLQTLRLIQPVKPLALPKDDPNESNHSISIPPYVSYTFTQEQTKFLYNSAMKKGVSLYSLILRDLFLTIDRWNKIFDLKKKSGTIRITVPVMFRHLLNPDLPATTSMSLIPVYQRGNFSDDPNRLLKTINSILLKAIRKNWGLIFLKVLNLLGKFKYGIFISVKFDPYTTAILSLIGEIDQFLTTPELERNLHLAGIKLDHVEGAMPLGKKTYLGITSLIYNKKLAITLSYHPKKMTKGRAQELLSLYVNQINQSIPLGKEIAFNQLSSDIKPKAAAAE